MHYNRYVDQVFVLASVRLLGGKWNGGVSWHLCRWSPPRNPVGTEDHAKWLQEFRDQGFTV